MRTIFQASSGWAVVWFLLAGLSLHAQANSQSNSDPVALLSADREQQESWAKQWLQSNDLRLVAWGATVARQTEAEELTPQLITFVQRYATVGPEFPLPGEGDKAGAMIAVLDALIQLRVDMQPSDLRPLFRSFPAQALILLGMSSGDIQPALLEIVDRARRDEHWLAATNLLLREAPSGEGGLAKRLLTRMTIRVSVLVFDPGTGGGYGGGVFSSCFGVGVDDRPRPGWPVAMSYSLTDMLPPSRSHSGTVVAGLVPVYFIRAGNPLYQPDPEPDSGVDPRRDRLRVQYLNHIVGKEILQAAPQVSISWEGPASFVQNVATIIADHVDRARQVAVQLASVAGLTQEEAAGFEPRIEVRIEDMRQGASDPLPAIEETALIRRVPQFSDPLL